jgi:L-asparagine transporter-like permease
MSYVSPDTVFAFLVNSYGTVAIFVYLLIASRSCACGRAWSAKTRRGCACACGPIRI